MVNIRENIQRVREEISEAAASAGRAASEVKLMGVTKYHPLEMMEEAAPYLDLIGENRVQEAYEKRKGWSRADGPEWHLIGHLQRNKIRRALECFGAIDSIDALETAVSIDRVLSETGRAGFPVLIEVNVSREAAKSGIAPDETALLLENIMLECPNIEVRGLMTVAADTEDQSLLHEQFAGLRRLRDQLRASSGLALPELSMGMSGDFKIAIKEGSTIVRVGSAIFGPRSY